MVDGSGQHEPASGVPGRPGAGSGAAESPVTLPAPRDAADSALGATASSGWPGGTRRDGSTSDPRGDGVDAPGDIRPSAVHDDQPDGSGDADDLSGTIAALTDTELDQSERRRLLGRLAGELHRRGISDLFRPRSAVRWMADAVSDVAPRLPIRDAETLRRHHPGLADDALAERLIRNAARTTAAIGAASGGVAAIEWAATPTLLSAPVLLAAETVAVVAIEIKLIGELQEVYRQPVPGKGSSVGGSVEVGPVGVPGGSGTAGRGVRAVALVQAWAHQRGVNPIMPGMGVAAVLGTAARRELRDRLLRRFGRNLTTYGPLLTGAAVASYLNRRATLALGARIRSDLIRHRQAELPR